MKLPVLYNDFTVAERREIREEYIKLQKGLCFYCNGELAKHPPKEIQLRAVTWSLFPKGFRDNPIHLQHDHKTGLTEGAVHMKCNAVMWQYEGR